MDANIIPRILEIVHQRDEDINADLPSILRERFRVLPKPKPVIHKVFWAAVDTGDTDTLVAMAKQQLEKAARDKVEQAAVQQVFVAFLDSMYAGTAAIADGPINCNARSISCIITRRMYEASDMKDWWPKASRPTCTSSCFWPIGLANIIISKS
jgi:hypothetical protein